MWLNRSVTEKSNIIENITEKNTYEKLLGVKVDCNLKFKEQLDNIFKKAGRKVNALSKTLSYMNFEVRCKLINSFFKPEFKYCPLL